MLKRTFYLDKIRPFYNDFGMIKVLIGMRRAGKSVLLNQIEEELLSMGIDSSCIVHINLDEEEYLNITTSQALHRVLKKVYQADKKIYLFIDEIQKIKNFESIIEAYRLKGNCSIFITGSNSYLLSGDLVTKLTGRYFAFDIYPFSYMEAVEYNKLSGNNERQKLIDYLTFGGLPKRFDYQDSQVSSYVKTVISEIFAKDLTSKVRDKDLFIRLLRFISLNPGVTISNISIQKYLKNESIQTTRKTIAKYLQLIESARLINFCHGYDLKGKKALRQFMKCYIADFGLYRYFNEEGITDIGRLIENLVYNELLIRGYEVYVGKTRNTEIDFIAIKDNKKFYFQVTYLLENESTKEREFLPLLKIKDNYPKFVLSLDPLNQSQLGIKHLHLVDDFLLTDAWERV